MPEPVGTHGSPASPRKATPERGQARILVVDDEWLVRNVAAEILRSEGYDVAEAEDGEQALAALERQPETDLVLLDLTMPNLSGEEVLRRARLQNAELKVLLTSGYDETELAGHVDDSPHTAFIQKPYDVPQLIEAIERLIGTH